MKFLAKILLAAAITGSLALTGALFAEEEIKHQKIEINALRGGDINVMVDTNGNAQTVTLSEAELADSELLEIKLANLDDETRETVLQELKGLLENEAHDPSMIMHGEDHKVIVVKKGSGLLMKMSGDNDIDIDLDKRHVIQKRIVLEDDSYDIIKDHTDAIAKLIERGEFSPQELDRIQAALDAKREE